MSRLQFYRATLSCNFIMQQSCSMQLCMSHTAKLLHKQELTELRIGQSCLCDKVAVCDMHSWSRGCSANRRNAEWPECQTGLTLTLSLFGIPGVHHIWHSSVWHSGPFPQLHTAINVHKKVVGSSGCVTDLLLSLMIGDFNKATAESILALFCHTVITVPCCIFTEQAGLSRAFTH